MKKLFFLALMVTGMVAFADDKDKKGSTNEPKGTCTIGVGSGTGRDSQTHEKVTAKECNEKAKDAGKVFGDKMVKETFKPDKK